MRVVRFSSMAMAMALAAYGGGAFGGDAAKGQALADAQCADCHAAADWEGESAEALTAMTKDIKAGKTKHKTKITLSDEEIAAISAYWASGAK